MAVLQTSNDEVGKLIEGPLTRLGVRGLGITVALSRVERTPHPPRATADQQPTNETAGHGEQWWHAFIISLVT